MHFLETMDSLRKKIDRQKYIKLLVIFLIFFADIFLLENSHLLHSSVKDDLNFMPYFCNAGFWQAVFSHDYKFRPVSNCIMWIVSAICKGDLYLYGYINVFLAAVCAFVIYLLIRKSIDSDLLAGAGGVLYIVSRFSYYQITTQLGVMETTSTLLGILFIWNLFRYMDTLKSQSFYYALICYALCSMSHERYTVLMPVLLYAWFVSGERKTQQKNTIQYYKKPIITLGVFVVTMVVFKFLLNNMMAGTGGTVVTETITLQSVVKHIIESVGYLFAVNSPEVWLTMVGWQAYSLKAKLVVIISIIMIFIIVGISIYEMRKMEKAERNKILARSGMFVLSIGALIFISSVTIRVELRWMYFPYMAAVFLLIYLSQIKKNLYLYTIKQISIIVYVVAMIGFGIYCRRGYYNNLYYWQDYVVANALSDSTYGEYGNKMYSKDWVIITSLEITDSYSDLMKQFDVFDEYDLKVEVIKSVEELSTIANLPEKEILYFDKDKYCFINITNLVDEYLCEGVSVQ